MTTARAIIRSALGFYLNKLSPGEQEDADLFGRCLEALNDALDEHNGSKLGLFRTILTASSPITGASATLGADWPALAPGDLLLGAVVVEGTTETPIAVLDMDQYERVRTKSTTGRPVAIYQDGASTVYIYPAAAAHVIKVRTKEPVAEFTDLDTDHVLPAGYKAHLSALVAERMAGKDVPPKVRTAASAARTALKARTAVPAIVHAVSGCGFNILTGDR